MSIVLVGERGAALVAADFDLSAGGDADFLRQHCGVRVPWVIRAHSDLGARARSWPPTRTWRRDRPTDWLPARLGYVPGPSAQNYGADGSHQKRLPRPIAGGCHWEAAAAAAAGTQGRTASLTVKKAPPSSCFAPTQVSDPEKTRQPSQRSRYKG